MNERVKSIRVVLHNVAPLDPLTIAAAAVVLLAVTALACHLPARAATRVDPIIILKSE